MKPGFPRPARAGEDAVGAVVRAVPPIVPDHALLQLIGRGSYGEVWLARNVLGALRAVKVVYRDAFENDRPYEREFVGIKKFEPVSRTHEGFVDLLQVGRNDDEGHYYYVMEVADEAASNGSQEVTQGQKPPSTSHAPGYTPKTLAHEIALRGALPVDECISLALSLAGAVAHLHKHGLIHRDIKPSNTIVVNGQIKLADIGLVSEVGDSRSYVGTEGYIPPEGPGTRQADLYSLGKLIYEASTGKDRTEFPALPVELIRSESGKRLLELNAVFVKACAQDPEQRYQSAEELQADLALLQSGKSVRHLRTVERRLRLMTRVGILGLALAVLAGGGYGFAKRQATLERENVLRIERAEKAARQQLWDALVAQARGSRRTGQGGQRFDSLEAIARASAIRPFPKADEQARFELRNEAIACLALPDLRVVRVPFNTNRNVSVDGAFERYAVGDARGGVEVRRINDGQLLVKLPPQSNAVQWVYYFSPNGQFLPVHYGDGITRVWDLARSESLLQFRPVEQQYGLDFSPDSDRLAAVDANRNALLYELPSGKLLRQESPGIAWLRVKFSPDGRLIGAFSETRTEARVVVVENGQTMAEFKHPRGVRALAWSPDGQRVATGCDDGNVYLFQPAQPEPMRILASHQSAVANVAFHPSGRILVSDGWDGTLRLWDPESGELFTTLEVPAYHLRFSHDGRRLTSYYEDGEKPGLWVFEVAADQACRFLGGRGKQELTPGPGAQFCVDFSPDGRWLVTGHQDGVRLWDSASGRAITHLPGGTTPSAFFHPDGKTLLASGAAGVLSWSMEAVLNSGGTSVPQPERLSLQTDCSRSFLSPNGNELAYLSERHVHLLRSKRQFNGPEGLRFAAMSPNGRWLAASTWFRNGGRLWDLESGRPVRDFAAGSSVIVQFSPDSRWLITAERDAFHFWEVESGQPGRRLLREGLTGVPVPIAFSADGAMMAVARSRTLIQLLNAESLKELASLEAPRSQMISWLAFDPSGTRLAAATSTPLIQLWDLGLLRKHLAEMGLDWEQPGGQRSTAGPDSKSSRTNREILAFRPEEWIQIARRRPGTRRNLLDLSASYNASLASAWDENNNLAALPTGVQEFDGIEYDVRGVIRLRSTTASFLPTKVAAISVRQHCRRLHFLHSTAWDEKDGTQIGSYRFHFADGQQAEMPIVYGRDVRNWWLTKKQHADGGPAAVWTGSTPAAERGGYDINLFHSAWENPRPEVEIRHLDFVSANTRCPPFLIAVTVE
jgi:WD40 repeat protein